MFNFLSQQPMWLYIFENNYFYFFRRYKPKIFSDYFSTNLASFIFLFLIDYSPFNIKRLTIFKTSSLYSSIVTSVGWFLMVFNTKKIYNILINNCYDSRRSQKEKYNFVRRHFWLLLSWFYQIFVLLNFLVLLVSKLFSILFRFATQVIFP